MSLLPVTCAHCAGLIRDPVVIWLGTQPYHQDCLRPEHAGWAIRKPHPQTTPRAPLTKASKRVHFATT